MKVGEVLWSEVINLLYLCGRSYRSGTYWCEEMDGRWSVSQQSHAGWKDRPDHRSQHWDRERNCCRLGEERFVTFQVFIF